MMKRITALLVFLICLISLNALGQHQLKPTPKTVAWGYYDASTPPALRIKSGDTVEIQTLITSSPSRLEAAGVLPDQVEQSLRDITKEVTNKGPGGHILTGPIFVEGAEPGDVLEVRIKTIKLAIPSEMAARRNSFALHHDGHSRRPERSYKDGVARDDRFSG